MGTIQNGQCVFFNEFQTGAHRKSTRVKVKNLAFGVLLGAIPPFGRDPSTGDLYRAMGAIGYCSFDDVAEFLGAELGQKCVEMFEKKYLTPVDPKIVPPPDDGAGKQVEGEMLRTYSEKEKLTQEGVADLLDKVEATEPSRILDAHGGLMKKEPEGT